MSSDVLVLGAMVVTGVAMTWWSLTPVSSDSSDNVATDGDLFDGTDDRSPHQ